MRDHAPERSASSMSNPAVARRPRSPGDGRLGVEVQGELSREPSDDLFASRGRDLLPLGSGEPVHAHATRCHSRRVSVGRRRSAISTTLGKTRGPGVAYGDMTFSNGTGPIALVAPPQRPERERQTVTSALRGLVRDDPRTRQEFLALTTRSEHDH